MSNKIFIELDKARIKEKCGLQRNYPNSYCPCSDCKQSEKEQIECMLFEGSLYIDRDYKIKEQDNEIKTKFKIGDRVYILEIVRRKWVVIPYSLNYDCVITEIAIRDDGLYYRTCLSIYSEKDCFLTKEKAQAEADRRNHEKGIY